MAFIPLTTLIAGSVFLFILYRIGLIIYRLYFHPLSKYPGPKHLAISGLFHLYLQNIRGLFYRDIRELHEKYGNIVRVGPNELCVDGSVGWSDAYGHRKAGQAEFAKDRLFYRPLDGGKGYQGTGIHAIFSADREGHRRQRRIIAHAFSDSALNEQESLVQGYVDLLIQRYKEHAVQEKTVDMVRYYNSCTFDIAGDLAFGESFHSLEDDTLHPWVTQIFPLIRASVRLRIFALYPYLKFKFFMRLILSDKEQNLSKQSVKYTADKLNRRFALDKNLAKKDFLSYILKHNGEKGMLHEEIIINSESFIVAGSETTATLLCGLTFLLASNPTIWTRLTKEVREAFGSEEKISMRSAAALPYLHACIEEGLRIYPPAAVTPPRISPGANVGGEFVPEGTRIWIHQWATNHREQNFLHADTFIPERWLPSSHPLHDSRFENDNKSALQPFATGPRNCVGKNLAYAEMRLIMARMAFNFELEPLEEMKGWMDGQRAFTVYEKPPLWMKLHLREDGKGEVKA